MLVPADFVTEELVAKGGSEGGMYTYRQYDNSFTQSNAFVCEHMLGWAQKQAAGLGMQDLDLCELHCGNGNFTVVLAPHFRDVFSTDVSRSSLAALAVNLPGNGVYNVQTARIASHLVARMRFPMESKQKVWLDRHGNIDIRRYAFGAAFVNPPRCGLDTDTVALLRQMPAVLYISCSPQSLARDIKLLPDHRVAEAALFDQFPYTEHIESGVLLVNENLKDTFLTFDGGGLYDRSSGRPVDNG